MDRIVLAYSGGTASSVAIPWLREQHHAEVVTVTVDLGQRESLDGIRVRAVGSGAARAHVLDRRDVFARHHLLPAIQAGAVDIDSGDAPVSFALPLLAHALTEIAQIEGATIVAHAASNPDQARRIDEAVKAIDPTMRVIDVAKEWTFSESDFVEYARERGIPLLSSADGGISARARATTAPAYITIDFRAGVPTKINGVEMDLVELLTSLDTIAAAQGVHGSAVLSAAYRALQKRTGTAVVTGAEKISVRNGACEVVTNV